VVKELLISSIKDPREKAERYLIEHHFPLALGLPATRDPMLGLSLACVLRPEDYANASCAYQRESGPMILVEHDFKYASGFAGILKDEQYLKIVRPDEEYMAHEFSAGPPTSYYLQETIDFTSSDPGPHRVFDFLKKHDGVSDDAFSQALIQGGQKLSDDPAIRKSIRKRVRNIVQKNVASEFSKTGVDFDAVIEYWVDDFAHLDSIVAKLRAPHADFVNAGACRTFLTRDYVAIKR
jgi:hypothetical protein